MSDDKLHFEDFAEGKVIDLGRKLVTPEEIIAFAAEFDPQPMHLSQEGGAASILGGLSASGWHSACMLMRMMIDGYLLASASEGAPGIDMMEWKRPVLSGDVLTGQSKVIGARPLRSRPGLGIVKFRHELQNQRGETVLISENSIMFRMAGPSEHAA